MRHRILIAISLIVGVFFAVVSQETGTEFKFDFRVGTSSIDPNFADNSKELARLDSLLRSIGKYTDNIESEIISLKLFGATSLEDSYEVNSRLSGIRMDGLEKFIRKVVPVADSVIVRDPNYIPWRWFKTTIANSEIEGKEELLVIADEEGELVEYRNGTSGNRIDSRILKMRELNEGRTWKQLNQEVFPKMRFAIASLVVKTHSELDTGDTRMEMTEVVPVIENAPVIERELPQEIENVGVEEEFKIEVPDTIPSCGGRYMHIKTNVLGWLLAQTNIALEFDMAEHWSVNIPAYYSAWNYFNSKLKFRTTDLKPGIRYWLSPCNEGWFGGVHFGLTWYNYAFKGEYRYQDHDRRTPAIGGGIDLGYRMPISQNGRWHLEFALGAGVYRLHYDKFLNELNGRRVGQVHKTYFGLDGASVSFTYRFSLDRKSKGGEE